MIRISILERSLKMHNFILSNFYQTLDDESRARVKKEADKIRCNLNRRRQLAKEFEEKTRKK